MYNGPIGNEKLVLKEETKSGERETGNREFLLKLLRKGTIVIRRKP